MAAEQFIAKLVALAPPPGVPMARYEPRARQRAVRCPGRSYWRGASVAAYLEVSLDGLPCVLSDASAEAGAGICEGSDVGFEALAGSVCSRWSTVDIDGDGRLDSAGHGTPATATPSTDWAVVPITGASSSGSCRPQRSVEHDYRLRPGLTGAREVHDRARFTDPVDKGVNDVRTPWVRQPAQSDRRCTSRLCVIRVMTGHAMKAVTTQRTRTTKALPCENGFTLRPDTLESR